MEVRVLGPVELAVGGRVWPAGPPQQRHTLAALAVDAGRPVTAETLIDRIWDEAPDGARRALHVHLTRIRRLLERADPGTPQARLVRRSGGYLLDVDSDCVDLHRFRRLARCAHTSAAAQAVTQLREARALWRGEPLTGLRGRWAAESRQAWRQQYLDVTVAWAQAELLAGTPAAVIGTLVDLAAESPFVESLAAVLLRALCAAGRPAEALDHYLSLRRRLVAELGTEPSAELQAVYQAILKGELTTPTAAALPGTPVPAQLPSDIAGFTGRHAQLAQLDALVDAMDTRSSTAVVISAVSGAAGIGKTALAVHWAHTVADRFPDGQLYVNLRGFHPDGPATSPSEAVQGFLDTLGVPQQRMPATREAQAALYRSLVAGRRVLVLLDNARDAEQVRPLLPGSPTALALVTSRNQLTGLVAVDGAHPVALDVLSPAESRELLVRRLGGAEVDSEPRAAQEIIAACARLPLALSIAAARAQQSRFALVHLAAELADAGQRLDALDAGDPASQVRTVFSWSTAALTPPTGALFRLLGLHPGPDISVAAAASLAGQPVPATRRMLTELARASLLVEHVPGRYTCHDLLRAYAGELVRAVDPQPVRQAAIDRLLDHYTHTAYAADRLLSPARGAGFLPLGPPTAGVHLEPLAATGPAMAWLTAERTVLMAILRRPDRDADDRTWQLAWALDTFLYRTGRWRELADAWRAGLRVAERRRDPALQAEAHRVVAHAETHLGRHAVAHSHLLRALDLADGTDDLVTWGRVHFSLAYHWLRQGDPARALLDAERALKLYRTAGHRPGQARALNGAGWCLAQVGRPEQALPYCTEALTLFQQLGDLDGEANTWQSLGYAQHQLGRRAEALDCYRRAVALYAELGDCYNEADAHRHLGDIHLAEGDPTAACAAWTTAWELFTRLGRPEADDVGARLTQAYRPTVGSMTDSPS